MKIFKSLLSIMIVATFIVQSSLAQMLKVSENGRYLVKENGEVFFYLGDTAWELFHRLDREEADLYLENRAVKGFNVIQAVVLAEHGGLDVPNAYDEIPLIDDDPARPNEKYFEHVDYIVKKAESLGMMIGMLPTWGRYWSSLNPDNTIFNEENARSYGQFLGKRYKDNAIIWILGGDRNITNDQERATIIAMAEGLKKGDDGSHLITFHPMGPGLSSDYFHNADWLDFNMFQSSHVTHDHDNGLFAAHDYELSPPKPTLDGEPRYESIPVGFYNSGVSRLDRFDDYDARQAAYWSVLSGACGHTYGNNSVWQMYSKKHRSVLWAQIPWYEAIDHPGSFQMGFMKKLFMSRKFELLEPHREILVDGPTTGGGKVKAGLARDGSYTIIYSPRGEQFTIDKAFLKPEKLKESWFDPGYGTEYTIHTSGTKGIQSYNPPTSGRGNDWVLIIEKTE